MGRQIKTIYKKAEASFNNPEQKKKWQGGIGVLVMVVFVLSSVLFNRTVQALNLAAGNYGYSSGSYGYNAGTSSDAVPAAPTSLVSSVTTTTATLTWTSPTLTTGGTSYDNAHATTPYLIHYQTGSSLSSCSGGSTATSTSASVTLSSLSSGMLYYVAVCAYDTNLNTSAALTGSFTTSSISSGGATGVGIATTIASVPVTPVVVVIAPVAPVIIPPGVAADAAQLAAQLGVTRNTALETTSNTRVVASAKEFGVTLTAEQIAVLANFVTYGIGGMTGKLGSGERLAVARDILETVGRVSLTAMSDISNGRKPQPTDRNLPKEQKTLTVVLKFFQKITGKAKPDFKNEKEDLIWNTLLYRIRFPRDLAKEKVGIAWFKQAFKRTPKTPLDWSVVRAKGYVESTASKCYTRPDCKGAMQGGYDVTQEFCKETLGGESYRTPEGKCVNL